MRICDRRVQTRHDERRYRRISAIAQERRTSAAAVVREAIDLLAPTDVAGKPAAATRILMADPMPVPDPDQLRAELEEIRGGLP
jgi:hypothetical protein